MTPSVHPTYNPKDFTSPVTDAFVKSYADGTLVLDCPRITLRQNLVEEPRLIQGRGMIWLENGSEFRLRMYADDDTKASTAHPFEKILASANWKSGEIIPPSEYYELEATDLFGFNWSCKKLDISVHSAGHGVVVTGRLYDALMHRSTGATATLPPLLSMFFFEDLPVALNQLVLTERRAGERNLGTNLSAEFAKFEAGQFTFELQKTEASKGSTILRAYGSEGEFPMGIEVRIEESLRYVTFSPVQWCIVDKRHGGVREVTVVPPPKQRGTVLDEPLNHQRPDCAVDYWRLFSAYFQYTLECSDPTSFHPLSARLFHVISSGTRQLDLLGLLISVAVEGVLNVAYKELAKPTDNFCQSLDKVSKVIGRLRCADSTLAKRLHGVIPPMKSARPKDKFKMLVEHGVVTGEMVKAWEKLRNTTAHASIRVDPTVSQTLLNQCHTVYTMLNRLIFQTIGYSGRYQDFSVLGWPIEQFTVKVLE
ncbi:hypothetical protein [Burkholderia glumae]|uniref:hypothetical protein n=1 Tax=Burkholderia glumae TaxID=337 RepID=UPI00148EEC86|nr:hypothetical protein [Burkholderia glumae]QJW78723.1 hypothetical protein GAS18_08115 [Burkholderia glumae]